jgi:hypothetical protein
MIYEKPMIMDFGSITQHTFWRNNRPSPADHDDKDQDAQHRLDFASPGCLCPPSLCGSSQPCMPPSW